jgi:uncharacterized protein YyaL (SSP411 family)
MKESALKNFEFLESKFRKNDSDEFNHTYKNQVAKVPAFLDDYAYLIEACIHLQEITSDTEYLQKAKAICEYVIENFSDKDAAIFYYTHKHQQDVIVRKKEIYDGATPSPNSVMASNLNYLAVVFDNPKALPSGNPDQPNFSSSWQEHSLQMVQSLVPVILKYPTSFSNWAQLILVYVIGMNEVAIVGPEYSSKRDEFLKQFFPALVLQSSPEENSQFPLLAAKPESKETPIYICKSYRCLEPINDLLKSVSVIQASSKI